MRFFFDTTPPAKGGTEVRVTPTYLEIETSSMDPAGVSYLYCSAGPIPHSLEVTACFERELDGWLGMLQDEKRQRDYARLLARTYPEVWMMVENGANSEVGKTCLNRVYDPDDMQPKWCLTRTVGNLLLPTALDHASVEEFLRQPKLLAAYRALIDDAFRAARELMQNNPPKSALIEIFGREYARQQIYTLKLFAEWGPKISALAGL